MELYTIVGATGNIGSKVTKGLLERGKKVRAVGRNPVKLKTIETLGADIEPVDVKDADALKKVFSGATACFTMIPPNYAEPNFRAYMRKVSETLITAIEGSGVKWVVNLSSIGAQEKEHLGPINGLNEHEERLNKIEGVNVLHVRPVYFMENLLWNVDLVKKQGINGTPMKGDVRRPFIATQDIANVVVDHLINRDFKGKSIQELLGERDVSFQEVTQIIGSAVGKSNLPYVQFPYEDAEKAMVGMGMSADAARLMVEMQKGFNDGIGMPTEPRSKKNTTPTSIETFIKNVFVPVYNSTN